MLSDIPFIRLLNTLPIPFAKLTTSGIAFAITAPTAINIAFKALPNTVRGSNRTSTLSINSPNVSDMALPILLTPSATGFRKFPIFFIVLLILSTTLLKTSPSFMVSLRPTKKSPILAVVSRNPLLAGAI